MPLIDKTISREECPKCGKDLYMKNGVIYCKECAWSHTEIEALNGDGLWNWWAKTSPKSSACDNKKPYILQMDAPVSHGGGSKSKRAKKPPKKGGIAVAYLDF